VRWWVGEHELNIKIAGGSMGVAETMELVARGVEVVGIATLALGLVVALVQAARVLLGGREAEEAYRVVRTVFGRSILLGLEFLVAADIIRTVAVEPSVENVGVLGLIVLIRTFLSFSLEVEIDGTWPWRRADISRASVPRESSEPQRWEPR
jgi:uncharacterized membrane protein